MFSLGKQGSVFFPLRTIAIYSTPARPERGPMTTRGAKEGTRGPEGPITQASRVAPTSISVLFLPSYFTNKCSYAVAVSSGT